MNIGIITEPLWGNIGGILQNYALQQILIQLGHHPITLELMRKRSGLKNILFQAKNIFKFICGHSKTILLPYAPLRQNIGIEVFIKTYINTSNSIKNSFPAYLIKKYDLDAIIVGSDQVWRPKYNPNLSDMYLDFCKSSNILKIAYAASFGTSEWEYTNNDSKKCSKLLQYFDGVSVRECSGIRLLKKLNYHYGQVVIDPTLLLGREGFDKLLIDNGYSKTNERYLGCYILDLTENLKKIIYSKSERIGLDKVKIIQEKETELNPIEWIHCINNSTLFITDSFHGTVFCLLYHVPFITLANRKRGADRFISLLEPLGLIENLVFDINCIEGKEIDIDWNKIDNILDKNRDASLSFLKSQLSKSTML